MTGREQTMKDIDKMSEQELRAEVRVLRVKNELLCSVIQDVLHCLDAQRTLARKPLEEAIAAVEAQEVPGSQKSANYDSQCQQHIYNVGRCIHCNEPKPANSSHSECDHIIGAIFFDDEGHYIVKQSEYELFDTTNAEDHEKVRYGFCPLCGLTLVDSRQDPK